MQYRLSPERRVMFRYMVKDENEYPGFDGLWREMSESEQRDTLRMGGRVAEWLKSLKEEGHINGSEAQ